MDMVETDKVYVNLKSSAAEHVKRCYGDLGWQVCGERTKKLHKNFIQVAFCRPHFINNRDELLLLQVRLDIALNQIGKIDASRKRRALGAGLCFALASIVFFAYAALLFALYAGAASAVAGGFSALFGLLSAVACGAISTRLYRADGKICEGEIREQMDVISGVCQRARELREADDGQQ